MSERLGIQLKRRNRHISYITVTESIYTQICTKVYEINEHSEETKAMLTKHILVILDILAEKPKEAQEFSIFLKEIWP